MGIGNYGAKTLTLANPRTGALIQNISYSSYGALAGVAFDGAGQPVVLTASNGDILGMVHHGSDHIELPAVPSQFDYCGSIDLAAVAGPGPDFVSLISWPMGQAEVRTLPAPSLKLQANPNPCRASTLLHLTTGPLDHSTTLLRVYDAQGRLVYSVLGIRTSSFPLDLSSLPAGVYVCRLSADSRSASTRLVVTR